MRILYHHWLSPVARRVRLALHEKRLIVHEQIQEDWVRDENFLALNPAGTVPVLVDEDGQVISDGNAICEYLEDVNSTPSLIPGNPGQRAEVRRLVAWFDLKFNAEVTYPLVSEKLMKRMIGGSAPDSRSIRAGRANVNIHLDYIAWLTDRRKWLAGNQLTLADFAAAAHISLIDYMGDVPWDQHPLAKEWYVRLKSRPCFRTLLQDQVPGVLPPRHYADLDF
ncbi:glutathione S-transferase family protein [Insolitispirillum peregrinum]|uniref:Glutathione S-transferase n=1 Tax=Insolitispirillum peregrinum TaxID=80876 RepID=A0A1N7JBY5_9PROT|nr:glutathione S-transferase family protein [Insolitispirillum peregrinum]SIS46807.1 glutathione S-transferase [Insolitispirillum peregrinum]